MLPFNYDAGWSSLVARWAHNPKVASSNLVPATNQNIEYRRVLKDEPVFYWGSLALAPYPLPYPGEEKLKLFF